MDESLKEEIGELFEKLKVNAVGVDTLGDFQEIARPYLLRLNEILERLSPEELAKAISRAHGKYLEATPEALSHIPVIVLYRDGGHGWGFYPKPPDGSRPRMIVRLLNISGNEAEYGRRLWTTPLSSN